MLDWDKLLTQVAVVTTAPAPFLIAILIVAGLIWWAMDWRYSTIVGNKESEVALAKSQRDDYRDKLGGATPDQAKAAIQEVKKTNELAEARKAGDKKPLVDVIAKHFYNERVQLDGFRYRKCKFQNVTLVINGGYFELIDSDVKGFTIASDSAEINSAISVLFHLGIIKGDGAMTDTGVIKPSNPVPDLK
jgi:hypothetical protein